MDSEDKLTDLEQQVKQELKSNQIILDKLKSAINHQCEYMSMHLLIDLKQTVLKQKHITSIYIYVILLFLFYRGLVLK